MTAWTAPRTWVVAEKLFASLLNTHVRDNLLYVKEVLAGTHTDKIPNAAFTNGTIDGTKLISASVLNAQLATGIDGAKLSAGSVTGTQLASALTITTSLSVVDAFYAMTNSSGFASMLVDSTDFYRYDRTNNYHEWYTGNVLRLRVDSNGKLTGSGIYDSGQFSLAGGAGSNVTLNPGFPVGQEGPRFVWGLYGATNVTVNAPIGIGGNLSLSGVTSNTITVTKAGAAAAFGHVWAIY